jgi:thiaminase
MKNITLSAEKDTIDKAREKAKKQNTSLNKIFRKWLENYVSSGNIENEYEEIMKRLENIKFPGKFSREEMNER